MEIKQLFQELRSGRTIPLGFESPYTMNQAFINELLDAGVKGIECTLQSDSSFAVSDLMVKDANSPAFARNICNISVKLQAGKEKSVASISIGTLTTLAVNGGKAVLIAHQPTFTKGEKMGEKMTNRAGQPVYNINAVNPVAFIPEMIDTLESFVASFQSDEIGAPANAGKK